MKICPYPLDECPCGIYWEDCLSCDSRILLRKDLRKMLPWEGFLLAQELAWHPLLVGSLVKPDAETCELIGTHPLFKVTPEGRRIARSHVTNRIAKAFAPYKDKGNPSSGVPTFTITWPDMLPLLDRVYKSLLTCKHGFVNKFLIFILPALCPIGLALKCVWDFSALAAVLSIGHYVPK